MTSRVTQVVEFEDGYAFAHSQLLPNLFLESILLGIMTSALFLFTYQTFRQGVIPFNDRVRARVTLYVALLTPFILLVAHWALSKTSASDLLFGAWLGILPGTYDGRDTKLLLYSFKPIILECLLNGMFCTLSVVAVYVFVQRNLRIRSHQIMLAVAMLMFAVSLIHLVLQMRLISVAYNTPDSLYPGPRFDPVLTYAPVMLVTINVILGDAIVLWRMCALFRHSARSRILALILLAPTFTLSVANLAQEFAGGNVTSEVTMTYDVASLSDFTYGTAILALSLVTNLVSTIAIGWKTWLYRKELAEQLPTFSRRSIVEKVMSRLVESGTIYCIIWALYIVDSRTSAFDPSRGTLNDQPTSKFYTGGAAYFSRIMAQVTGIYPTIILVIVALESGHLEISESKLSTFVAAVGSRSTRRSKSGRSRAVARSVGRAVADTFGSIVSDIDVEAARPLTRVSVEEPYSQSSTPATPDEASERKSVHSTRTEPMREAFSMHSASIRQTVTMPAAIPHQPRPVRISTLSVTPSSQRPLLSSRHSSASGSLPMTVGSEQLLRGTDLEIQEEPRNVSRWNTGRLV